MKPLQSADSSADLERASCTLRWEIRRALPAGLLETATQSLFVLIAIRAFHAGPTEKALLSSAGSFGNLISPFVVFLAQYFALRPNHSGAILHFIAGIALLTSTWTSSLTGYVLSVVLAAASCVASVPFLSQIYQENYPSSERGQLVARGTVVRILVSATAAVLVGLLLNDNIQKYWVYLGLLGVATLYGSYALSSIPAENGVQMSRRELFSGFRALRDEPLFRVSIIAWMLVGLGSFMSLPLRTELLSNAKYGLGFSEFHIALLVVTVPNIGRILVTPVWGKLFDRFHFTTIRTVANATAVLSILTFFTSDTLTGLIVGSLLQGAAIAGGELCWVLWTTQIAKGKRVASYTAVHTFFTGVRGVVGPMIGFHLLGMTSPMTVAAVATALMLASTVLFVREGREVRRRIRPVSELPVG